MTEQRWREGMPPATFSFASMRTIVMRSLAPTRNATAFTLVELLVAVGIIALLIGILFPVLARARTHANSVRCAANLRSIGHALMMYTERYAYYPATVVTEVAGPAGTDAAIWPARLRPFLGGDRNVFYCPSRDEQFRWSDDGPLPLLRVQPSSPCAAYGYDPGDSLVHGRAYFSYGYNSLGTGELGSIADGTHKGLGYYVSPSDYRNQRELRAARVKVPEDMVALTDSNADGWVDYITSAWSTHPLARPGTAHNRGTNVLFCDGHVDWFRLQDLCITDRNDPAQASKVRRWNNDHSFGL